MNETTNRPPSAIASVSTYIAAPVETCDRCSAAIKIVTVVVYKDGFREKFGSECINKILSGDTSLKSLFNRNVKRLAKAKRILEIFSRPLDQIPHDRGYRDGFYMIAEENGGRAICLKHYYFHPTYLVDAHFSGQVEHACFGTKPFGTCWIADTRENWEKRCISELEDGKAELRKQIDRLEKFLARVLAKGMLAAAATPPSATTV